MDTTKTGISLSGNAHEVLYYLYTEGATWLEGMTLKLNWLPGADNNFTDDDTLIYLQELIDARLVIETIEDDNSILTYYLIGDDIT